MTSSFPNDFAESMALREESQTHLSDRWKHLTSQIRVHNWTILAVVLVQLSLFAFAWTLAGLMIHMTIAMPDSKAEWIQSNPGDTQFIVTLISTIFALTSSFLLSKAVQFALVRRLTSGSLRLTTMVEWAKLAQRSLSLNGRVPWIMLSVAWVALLGFLTTAWSSLLAPQSVIVYNNFQDYDLNFLNPSLSNIIFGDLSPPHALDASNLFDYLGAFSGIDVVTAVLNAGVARIAIINHTRSPTQPSTSFISIPYSLYVGNATTGGIGISPSGKLGPSPPSVGITGPGNGSAWYQGLSRTYSVTQQGFTANVSCRVPISNDPVITPNITESFKTVSDPNHSIYMYSWNTNCSSDVQSSTAGVTKTGVVPGNGLLMASICLNQGFMGPSNQSFLILLGAPSGSTYLPSLNLVCQVTPLVTTVQTTYYEQSNIINITQPLLSQHTLPDPTSINSTVLTAWYPAAMIWSIFVQSQGINSNLIGDQISAAVEGPVSENIIELYLCGMIEQIGTIIKSQVDVREQTETGALSQLNGTVVVQTYGWTFHLRTHGPSLAAITLVTVLTVAAWVYTILKIDPSNETSGTGKPRAPLVHAFNPTDTLVVLLASSAGDLSRVLSESADSDNVYRREGVNENRYGCSVQDASAQGVNGRLRVVLKATEKGSPALNIVGVDDAGINDANEDTFQFGMFRHCGGMRNKDSRPEDGYIQLEGMRTMSVEHVSK